jgi:alpha-glucosidase
MLATRRSVRIHAGRLRFAAVIAAVALVCASPLPLATAQEAPTQTQALTQWSVSSPDGTVEATVSQEAAGAPLSLAISRDGRQVVAPSLLGIETSAGSFITGLEFAEASVREIRSSYRAPVGKQSVTMHHSRQLTLTFESAEGSLLLDIRAANDGAAYRYRVPGAGGVEVYDEASAFRMQPGADAWLLDYSANYENVWRPTSVGETPRQYGFPALFQTGPDYVLLTEAGVTGNYAASRLRTEVGDTSLFRLTFPEDTVESDLPLATPWRLAITGDLDDIVESTLVTDLGGSSRIEDFSWVDPGVVAWSWWSESASPSNFERQREYVDFASRNGWEYVLVDEGWSADWMPELVDYAAERGVRIIVWVRWTDLDTQAEREARLPLWKSWGVAGIKADFMDSDTQARMQWYDTILERTANLELMINFHGATIPRGLNRVWPHVMTLEAVRGAEYYKWSTTPTPVHNAILPFTRNVVGSMDYTPVTFSTGNRATTSGHELALAVVYESGWQHLADGIESYEARPVARSFLNAVPAAWDATEFLSGAPGTEATLARRSGQDWYVGSIIAGGGRSVSVPLGFLDGGTRYAAEIVRDATGGGLQEERRMVSSTDEITVDVPANGGFAVHLCPAPRPDTVCGDVAARTPVTIEPEGEFVTPGETSRVEVTVSNNAPGELREVLFSLSAPDGWQVQPASPTTLASVPPEGSATARFDVTAPKGTDVGRYPLDATVSYDYAGGGRPSVDATADVHIPPPAPTGDSYVSDLEWIEASNGWGPVERDMSNGEQQAADGETITIAGQTFAKGLGVHAPSRVRYYLGGNCSAFHATVGVDDEAGTNGSVSFEVHADGAPVFESGVLTGAGGAEAVEVPLTGADAVTLVVTDAGDGINFDHADWADARLECS